MAGEGAFRLEGKDLGERIAPVDVPALAVRVVSELLHHLCRLIADLGHRAQMVAVQVARYLGQSNNSKNINGIAVLQ